MAQFPTIPTQVQEDIEAVKNLPKLDINSAYVEPKPEVKPEPIIPQEEDLESGFDDIASSIADHINLQLTPKKEMTIQEAGERARKVYDISVKEELPMSFVDKNLEFYDQDAYKKKVESWKEAIGNMPDAEIAAQLALSGTGNLFGLTSYMSRKGWLFNEESRGDTSAYFDALEQFHAEMNRPEINFMGKTVKLPHPAYIAGGVAKTAAEFAMLPGAEKAATWMGKLAETAGKFGAQTALQAPTMQEHAMPNDAFIKQRALAVLKSGVTGAGVGLAGNFIKNPFYRIPVVTGGFMSLTALEGGTPEQILETGIQILGFELLGMAQNAAMGKVKMKDVVEKAKEVVPELKKTSDAEIEAILKEFAGTPTMPVEATKQGMGADIRVAKEVPEQLEPVGTGETKPSRLSERHTERVNKISNELSELFKADEYQTTSKEEQAMLIAGLETKDIEKLIRIAEWKEPDTGGILPNAAWVHLANEATVSGDVDLNLRLKNSKTSRVSTAMGQNIQALSNLDESSAVGVMKKVETQKAKNVDAQLKKQGTDLKTEQAKMAGEMKTEIKKKSLDMDRFVKAVESIRCK